MSEEIIALIISICAPVCTAVIGALITSIAAYIKKLANRYAFIKNIVCKVEKEFKGDSAKKLQEAKLKILEIYPNITPKKLLPLIEQAITDLGLRTSIKDLNRASKTIYLKDDEITN